MRVAERRSFVHSGGQLEGLSEESVELGLDQHTVGVRHLRKHIFTHNDTQLQPIISFRYLREHLGRYGEYSQRSLSTSFPPHSVASMAFTDSTSRRLSGSLQQTQQRER